MPQLTRIGVDIGGTFTDVVLTHQDKQHPVKVLTTHDAPEDAIMHGVHLVCEMANITPNAISQIIHGTTLATNALIERKGAKVVFITTQGFRDVLEMRTESRFEQYDLNLTLPTPLVERAHRHTVCERIGANGQVLVPLEQSALAQLADALKNQNYQSIAVGLLHSYANPTHEEAIGEYLAQQFPHLPISLSSAVSPQMREYERFSTVVANAYVKPLIKNYLSNLVQRLAQIGVTCPIYLMHSGGGIISLEQAAELPVRLVESGPAGGAIFASTIAAKYQIDKALSFDMGGTTAKICLINQQTPKTERVFEAARSYRFKKGSGMPISIPVIDMVEIGAGGGSLAHLDAMQQIKVGPQSAGSAPGPACYQLGGAAPTVTDADLVLGKLSPDTFAGGKMTLSHEHASTAIKEHIGQEINLDAQTAAYGIAEMVDENMANATRVHAVENGEDISHYTMIAFGGCAPLHAVRLCEKIGIKRLLVPAGAGVGSAIGFLQAPFSFEATKSLRMPLGEFNPDLAQQTFAKLRDEAGDFVRQCSPNSPLVCEFKVYMRYIGQGWEIPITLTEQQAQAPDAATFTRQFEDSYAKLFGQTVADMVIEIIGWAVNASTVPDTVTPITPLAVSEQLPRTTNYRPVVDAKTNIAQPTAIIAKDNMTVGSTVHGAAVIFESQTATVLSPRCTAVLQPDGCLDITLKSPSSP